MIVEDFDILFSTDIFAQTAQYIPLVGSAHNIDVIFNEPFIIPNEVESNDYTAVGQRADFLNYPMRGDEIIIGGISYLVITPQNDMTGTVVTLELEVK